jgi:hypothetical protein
MLKGFPMNHQPFENWILAEEKLSPENSRALQDHLETCQQCQQLQSAWTGVVELFQEVPQVEPAPGFASRFQERLAVERQIERTIRNRWQSIIMLILICNVIAALVILLGTQFLTTFDSPLELFLSGVYRLASVVSWINVVQNIFFTLFKTATSIVPVGLWALLGIGSLGAGAIWIISLTSFTVLPRRN